MKKLLLFLLVLIVVSFALNGIWEYGQFGIFYSVNGEVSFNNYDLLTNRIVLDIIITLIMFAIMTVINLDWKWFLNWDYKDTFIMIFFSIMSSFYLEVNSLFIGRWTYSNQMPILIGTEVGIIPIIQWMIILPLSIYITKWLLKNRIKSTKRYTF